MIRKHVLRTFCAAFLFIGLLQLPGNSVAQEDSLPSELDGLTTAGNDVALLAGGVIAPSTDAPALELMRLLPGATSDATVSPLGPELWYVESGTLTLTREGEASQTYLSGEQAIIQSAGRLSYQIDGDNCPSVLRLILTGEFAMEVGSEIPGPAIGGEIGGCPGSGRLLDGGPGLVVPSASAYAFIARVSFANQAEAVELTLPGPMGYAPELGTVALTVYSGTNALVTPGSWLAVNGNQVHSVGAAGDGPIVALIAGLAATESDVPPTPTAVVGVQGDAYVSPTYGYSISWDDTWSVVAESSNGADDLLQLNNGIGDVYLQSYGNYTGNPQECVTSIAEQFPNNPGWSEIEEMPGSGAEIGSGSGPDRAAATYRFHYSGDGFEGDYVEYLECRTLVPGQAILVITLIAPLEQYESQVAPGRNLLERLQIP